MNFPVKKNLSHLKQCDTGWRLETDRRRTIDVRQETYSRRKTDRRCETGWRHKTDRGSETDRRLETGNVRLEM